MKKLGVLMILLGIAVGYEIVAFPAGVLTTIFSALFAIGYIATGVLVLTGVLDPERD